MHTYVLSHNKKIIQIGDYRITLPTVAKPIPDLIEMLEWGWKKNKRNFKENRVFEVLPVYELYI